MEKKFEWDELLSLSFRERWSGIALALDNVKLLITRSYSSLKINIRPLNIFVGASTQAYGAVAYLSLVISIINALETLGISLPNYMLSDSQIVLNWLAKDETSKNQFVRNRIKKIK